jgi:hypothetical protein
MVSAGRSSDPTEERPAGEGCVPSVPKPGRLTMPLLPPRTETPGTAGDPLAPLPVPPGPAPGEIPPRAIGSEPGPVLSFPPPGPGPENPLPEPLPRPIEVPPPAPPRPGFAPPEGDMARDPDPPVPGTPTFDPGWFETTIPAAFPFPPELAGAETSPTSPAPPSPMPRLPRPRPLSEEPPETVGGGGTTPAPNRAAPAVVRPPNCRDPRGSGVPAKPPRQSGRGVARRLRSRNPIPCGVLAMWYCQSGPAGARLACAVPRGRNPVRRSIVRA